MNRRDFIRGMAGSLILGAIPLGLIRHLRITEASSATLPYDDEEFKVKVVAIGFGSFGAGVLHSLDRDCHISCLKVDVDPAKGNLEAFSDLLSAARMNDLVLVVADQFIREDAIIAEGLGEAALEAGNLPIMISPEYYVTFAGSDPLMLPPWPNPRIPSITASLFSPTYTPSFFEKSSTAYDRAVCYVARHVIRGISRIATERNMPCTDFADMKAILGNGHARFGIGVADGPDRATIGASRALERLRMQEVDLSTVSGVYAWVEGDPNMGMDEFDRASKMIHDAIPDNTNIIVALLIDGELGSNMKVTVVAVEDNSAMHESLGLKMEQSLTMQAIRNLSLS